MCFFSDFQYGFRSSRSTTDLLRVVFDRNARAFNRSEAIQTVALDIFKALSGFGMLIFFTNVNSDSQLPKKSFYLLQ